jgi:hypothetical protein
METPGEIGNTPLQVIDDIFIYLVPGLAMIFLADRAATAFYAEAVLQIVFRGLFSGGPSGTGTLDHLIINLWQ